jgi:thiol:disulfide interchange protein DsbD
MRLKNYFRHLLKLTLPFCAFLVSAQTSPQLAVNPPEQITVKRGATATVKVTATLSAGYHLNSHTPAESFLIPLTLKWTPPPESVDAAEVVYPKPQMVKVPFQETPLSVLTGKFEISTKFKAPANASVGPTTVTGKLRYQACNDKSCFPPKTIDVKVPVEVQ